MSTIAIVTVDGGGNLPPTLRIADELARRGHRVRVFGQRRQADAVIRRGHAFGPLDALEFWDRTVRQTVPAAVADAVRLASDRAIEREVRESVGDADAAIVDGLMASAVRGARSAGVPTAALLHTFLAYWERSFRRGPIGIGARLRGVDLLAAWRDADARIVTTDPGLDPASSGRSALARASEWIGAVETGVQAEPDTSTPPLVVVSLSTTWFPGQTDAYQHIATALGSLPVRAVMTLGGLRPDRELHAPPNVRVMDRGDHGALFPEASLIVCHGGHSTTFRALAHGLPTVLLPMHPLLDQPMIAKAVEHAGAGRLLPRTARPERIAKALAAILADPGVRASAIELGERLRATDAASAGADVVERLVGAPGRASRAA
ncbi:MAG TPA: nucleotide disphospho-sugar-binding domain-containing protein [Agromyces mariniharenae]|nr:nucleotide disphospho-sugar-binding domain-containing protein [Agromyces mariniharenae]